MALSDYLRNPIKSLVEISTRRTHNCCWISHSQITPEFRINILSPSLTPPSIIPRPNRSVRRNQRLTIQRRDIKLVCSLPNPQITKSYKSSPHHSHPTALTKNKAKTSFPCLVQELSTRNPDTAHYAPNNSGPISGRKAGPISALVRLFELLGQILARRRRLL